MVRNTQHHLHPKARSRELFVDGSADLSTFKIFDEHKREISIEKARGLWLSGRLQNWNLSFQRLAQFGFNIDSLRNYYREQRRKQEVA